MKTLIELLAARLKQNTIIPSTKLKSAKPAPDVAFAHLETVGTFGHVL